MKSTELRGIATKGQHASRPALQQSQRTGDTRSNASLGSILYYSLLVCCGFTVLGAVGLMLEDPAAREARYAEEARREQIGIVERQQAEVEATKQAKEYARTARLDACSRVEIQAFAVSQDAVRARLKSPSTASFPWTPIASQHTGDCKFQVLAYVDAQNGFGAMVRSNYVATLTYDPATKHWRVTSVKLEN